MKPVNEVENRRSHDIHIDCSEFLLDKRLQLLQISWLPDIHVVLQMTPKPIVYWIKVCRSWRPLMWKEATNDSITKCLRQKHPHRLCNMRWCTILEDRASCVTSAFPGIQPHRQLKWRRTRVTCTWLWKHTTPWLSENGEAWWWSYGGYPSPRWCNFSMSTAHEDRNVPRHSTSRSPRKHHHSRISPGSIERSPGAHSSRSRWGFANVLNGKASIANEDALFCAQMMKKVPGFSRQNDNWRCAEQMLISALWAHLQQLLLFPRKMTNGHFEVCHKCSQWSWTCPPGELLLTNCMGLWWDHFQSWISWGHLMQNCHFGSSFKRRHRVSSYLTAACWMWIITNLHQYILWNQYKKWNWTSCQFIVKKSNFCETLWTPCKPIR